MKRSSLVNFFAVVVFTLLAATVIGGCGQRVKLGPMPPTFVLPDPNARQMASKMRTWLQNMEPSDAKTLNDTGHIVFSWEKLKASDPKRARIIDDYTEQRRRDILDACKKQLKGKPLPAKVGITRLAAHHNPDTIEFERMNSGEYRVVIRSTKGLGAAYLQISMP
jgi:hypothetical protein